MIEVHNEHRYLQAVIQNYENMVEGKTFDNSYDARRKLWHTIVIILENNDDPEALIDRVMFASIDVPLTDGQIANTVRSARAHVANRV